MSTTWDISHRPTTVDELCTYPVLKKQLKLFEKEKHFPNIMLHGFTGTGKTTIARILSSISDYDTDEINCNEIRDTKAIKKIATPPNTLAWALSGEIQLKILDEFHLWKQENQLLFNKVMEDYAEKIRYIICVNEFSKVADPIKSRCRCLTTDVCVLDERKNKLEVFPHAEISLDEWKNILRARAVDIAEKECRDGRLEKYSIDTIDNLLKIDYYCVDVRTFIRAVEQQIKIDNMQD